VNCRVGRCCLESNCGHSTLSCLTCISPTVLQQLHCCQHVSHFETEHNTGLREENINPSSVLHKFLGLFVS
jgi:hypothetical protein